MADIADCEAALVTLIAATLYPSGTGSASAVAAPCRVYRGWPNAVALDDDLKAGVVNVSVFPEAGGRNVTRYPRTWSSTLATPATLTAATVGSAVTFAGAGGINQLAGIRTPRGTWVYPLIATDTPTSVATALRAAIPGAGGSGAVVSMWEGFGVVGRVAGIGASTREVKRQQRPIRVSIWCPTVALRDAAASLIDSSLGGVDWMAMPDGTNARLCFLGEFVSDVPTKDALWRRDLRYTVEYATTATETVAQMMFGGGNTAAQDGSFSGLFGDLQPPTLSNFNLIVQASGSGIGALF